MTDDPTELWVLLRRTADALERAAEAVLVDEFDVTLARFALLSTLDASGCTINQQEAADLLGLNKASVSRQVEAATQDGHLEVAPGSTSRRERIHRLTPAGRAIVEAAHARLEAVTATSLADRRAASRHLASILTALD